MDTCSRRYTYLSAGINLPLTNSMEQSPSWEANNNSATQEIPHLLWNPKVHYCYVTVFFNRLYRPSVCGTWSLALMEEHGLRMSWGFHCGEVSNRGLLHCVVVEYQSFGSSRCLHPQSEYGGSSILPHGVTTQKTSTWNRLKVFRNRVLRGIFGPKRVEVAGDWRRLHNEELHNLYAFIKHYWNA
jgi:hypothetical protein